MKASELRIFNLVDLGNRIAKVIEINHLSCVVVDLEETQDTIEDYERTKPIPLTEEWLLKFGFKIDTKNFNWNAGIGVNEIGDFKLSLRYTESFGWFFKSRCTPIKYVHQLQNLYFAITSEELTLKSE